MRIALIAAFLAASGLAQAAVSTQKVPTDKGLVIGVSDSGVDVFKGIPFAAPPVGPLRWRAPQPAEEWKGVRAADKYGATCMQEVKKPPQTVIPRETQSEDCLTLNVFLPVNAKQLPVMVWIHGGGLTAGANSLPTYDGTAFAKGGVVLVSINYRVGRLGFFAHAALSKENADGGRLGNYGLMDQIAALQWVKRNIAAFGGDPNNVTIFGESAGGQSVDALMISPPARGLFHKAISQSGYGRAYHIRIKDTAPNGQASGETEGAALAKQWGLESADLAALRALPAATIADKSPTFGASLDLYLDGKIIDQELWAAFRAGKEAPVPLMIGSTGLEFPDNANADRTIRKFLSEAEEAQLEPTYGPRPARAFDLVSDILFTQQARALARMHQKNAHPVYVYLFDTVATVDAGKYPHARHGSELRFVFDTLHTGDKPATGEAESKAAKLMNAQWRNFATTGDPNGAGLPHWPRYDGQTLMEYTLGGAKAHPDARSPRLDALSRLIDPKS